MLGRVYPCWAMMYYIAQVIVGTAPYILFILAVYGLAYGCQGLFKLLELVYRRLK